MPIVAPATMATPLLLATEGFGVDLDILNGNLINLAILIPVLVWFLKGFLGGILSRRRETILQDLHEAESRLAEATTQRDKAQAELAAARETAQTFSGTAKPAPMPFVPRGSSAPSPRWLAFKMKRRPTRTARPVA